MGPEPPAIVDGLERRGRRAHAGQLSADEGKQLAAMIAGYIKET